MSKWTKKEAYIAKLLHAGFRKALDSTASNICWSIIYLLKDEEWHLFISSIEGSKLNKDLCLESIKYGNPSHAKVLFKIGLEMMTSEEYKILGEWCKQ